MLQQQQQQLSNNHNLTKATTTLIPSEDVQQVAQAQVLVAPHSHNDIRIVMLLLVAKPGTCLIELWEPDDSNKNNIYNTSHNIADKRWWYTMRLAYMRGLRYWGIKMNNHLGDQIQNAIRQCLSY